jgi:hypothetical protein
MRRTLLALLAAFAASASMAPSAFAEGAFAWSVGGTSLGSGSTKEIAFKDAKTFKITGELSGGKVEITSSKVSAAKGAAIFGGSPGTSEETLTFEDVTVTKPEGCAVAGEKITTKLLKDEVVGSGEPTGAEGETIDMIFSPKSGTALAEFELENEKCAIKGKAALSGSVLAETTAQEHEVEHFKLIFEAPNKTYKNAAEEGLTAGLKLGGVTATLTGEAELELPSKQQVGAAGGGLQAARPNYKVKIPKMSTGEATVVFINRDANANGAVTLPSESTLGGETPAWSKSAMQEMNLCKMAFRVGPLSTCTYKATFTSGNKAMGGPYEGEVIVMAKKVDLLGEVSN